MTPIQIAKWEFKITAKAKGEIDLFIFQKSTIEKLKRENELLKSLYKKKD
jgi:hypothetical protein